LFLIACGETNAPVETEAIGQRTDPIYYGELDTTHQAAVAYLKNGKCSATIIAVKGSDGYALTAGHCVSATLGSIRQGNDHANGKYDKQYSVVEAVQHPGYKVSDMYDFAMLRFSGADGNTPVIPPLAPGDDNLKKGAPLDMVGYGQTENGNTTKRRHVVQAINFETELRINFNQQTGGMCLGDSGGPALTTVSNKEYVAAVHSFVSGGGCEDSGTSMRVSAVYDTFIMPFINGTPYLSQSCNQCTEAHIANGQCTQILIDCYDDTDCDSYLSCIYACSTQSCVQKCDQQHPASAVLYGGIDDCICDVGCKNECSKASKCNGPTCGMSVNTDKCQACYEASCCQAAKDCSKSEFCEKCFKSVSASPDCQDDPLVKGLQGCLATNCSEECGVEPGQGGGGSGTGAGPATGGQGGAGLTTGNGGEAGQPPPPDKKEPVVVESSCSFSAPANTSTTKPVWLLALALAFATRRRRQSSVR